MWIFGYGSLMWRPGFAFEEAVPARVEGWRRGFVIYSTHHRGTHARPGLVLALDRGGACTGIAFRVAAKNAGATLAYLRDREQKHGVYRERHLPVRLADGSGREVHAIAYVAERNHPSYAGRLPLRSQVRLIRGAAGVSGPNLHYLISTVRHLEALGVRDYELCRLMALAGVHVVRKSCPEELRRTAQSLMRQCVALRVQVPLMRSGERRRFLYRLRIAEWTEPRFPRSTDT